MSIWADGLWAEGVWADDVWEGLFIPSPYRIFQPGIEYTIPTSVQTAPKIKVKTVSELRNVTVSMPGKLDEFELLSGIPIVSELTTSDLTITGERVNETDIKVEYVDTLAEKAIQFRVSGGIAEALYIIQVAALTTSTPPQIIRGRIRLYVEAD